MAEAHFYKFQYFMSIVPTVYTVGKAHSARQTIVTNQFAVTEQSHEVSERMTVPGLFFKYDIEPIQLTIEETRDGYLTFIIKVINILSGVLVAGHWGFTISDWIRDVVSRRKRQHSMGVIGNEKGGYSD
jgi:endoplasmic reticulum-Golgi intermediate compartment protein 2